MQKTHLLHPLFNYSIFSTISLSKWCVCALSYTILWLLGFYTSTNFETIANTVSWFLPAGVRVSFLLLVPIRYWSAIVVGEFVGMTINGLNLGFLDSVLHNVIDMPGPFIIYACAIFLFLKQNNRVDFSSVRSLMRLFLTLSAAALFTATLLNVTQIVFKEFTGDVIETIAFYVLGDFVGIFLTLPLAYLIVNSNEYAEKFRPSIKWNAILSAVVLFVVAIAITLQYPAFGYYLNLFAFVPAIYLSYRHEWVGAVLSIMIVNFVLLVTVSVDSVTVDVHKIQVYLIGLSSSSLLLGAAITQQRKANQMLKNNNAVLSDQLRINQNLANELVDVQKEERKKIANQLHDNIAQHIRGLKLNIETLEKSKAYTGIESSVKNIKDITEITEHSVYELLNKLRPKFFESYGLIESLAASQFEKRFPTSNVTYTPIIDRAIENLCEDRQELIYQIITECISSALKRVNATRISVIIFHTNGHFSMDVSDDGTDFERYDEKESFTLLSIKNHAQALQAEYSLSSSDKGTLHHFIFDKDIPD